jgi:hypothetical protein
VGLGWGGIWMKSVDAVLVTGTARSPALLNPDGGQSRGTKKPPQEGGFFLWYSGDGAFYRLTVNIDVLVIVI